MAHHDDLWEHAVQPIDPTNGRRRPALPSIIKLFLALFVIGGAIAAVGSLASAASRSCSGDLGERAVCQAERQTGDRYVWGAEGPSVFDCSGLTYFAYKQAGLNWGRQTAAGQYEFGRKKKLTVPTSKLRPGDLIFFDWKGDGIDHVGIYAGKGKMVHASSTSGKVKKVTLSKYYRDHMKPYAVRPEAAHKTKATKPDTKRTEPTSPKTKSPETKSPEVKSPKVKEKSPKPKRSGSKKPEDKETDSTVTPIYVITGIGGVLQ
ncbi:C40 family peptidase [Micromonospora zhanjiangensis]|uniref:C40 family peptidase n=1 Tax=Micromonospora zhanjiangensis TaxID=1522057 RepID=A0ABV8KEL7_9ACTN